MPSWRPARRASEPDLEFGVWRKGGTFRPMRSAGTVSPVRFKPGKPSIRRGFGGFLSIDRRFSLQLRLAGGGCSHARTALSLQTGNFTGNLGFSRANDRPKQHKGKLFPQNVTRTNGHNRELSGKSKNAAYFAQHGAPRGRIALPLGFVPRTVHPIVIEDLMAGDELAKGCERPRGLAGAGCSRMLAANA
jgi:hypothetical protein